METPNIKYFSLADGVLELHDDKIVIDDKAKRNKLFEGISRISWIIYSIAIVVKGYKEDFGFSFYLGIALLILWFFVAIKRMSIKETTESKIALDDIISVAFEKNRWPMGARIGKIKTSRNENRRILLITADLQDIKFKDELMKLNIVTTEK